MPNAKNKNAKKVERIVNKAQQAWNRLREIEMVLGDEWNSIPEEDRRAALVEMGLAPTTDWFRFFGSCGA